MVIKKLEKYGADKLNCLKKAMLHCPEQSIWRINQNNLQFYLFDNVPDVDRYIEEHNAYRQLLTDHGVEVYELSDLIVNNRELMSYLPNLAYLNDSSVITGKGAILSAMCPGGRQYEELVVREALTALGIPLLHTFEPGAQFEGLIPLSPDALFIADTERHSKTTIERFCDFALQHFTEIVYVELPQARRFMHPDMVFNQISDQLGLFFPPAYLHCWHIEKDRREEINFRLWMKQRRVELLPVSDEEQQKWATSFIAVEPNHIINYDISLKSETRCMLESMGVRLTQLHPNALLAGGGSLRCLTLRLLQE